MINTGSTTATALLACPRATREVSTFRAAAKNRPSAAAFTFDRRTPMRRHGSAPSCRATIRPLGRRKTPTSAAVEQRRRRSCDKTKAHTLETPPARARNPDGKRGNTVKVAKRVCIAICRGSCNVHTTRDRGPATGPLPAAAVGRSGRPRHRVARHTGLGTDCDSDCTMPRGELVLCIHARDT